MSEAQAKQERLGVTVMSAGSIFLAVIEFLDRPEPGDFIEADPDWYVTFNLVLHGAILLLLLAFLFRLPKMMADRPALRLPFLAMMLVGITAAAYVVGRDLGLV